MIIKQTIKLFSIIFCIAACKQPALQQFTDVSESSGITFSNNITESEQQKIFTYEYMYNGAGVAIGDVNNDGLSSFQKMPIMCRQSNRQYMILRRKFIINVTFKLVQHKIKI